MATGQVPDCKAVATVLSEIRLVYAKFNSKAQLELSELAVDSVQLISTFICKLLEGGRLNVLITYEVLTFTPSAGEVNATQLQCLTYLLSIMSSWCDKNKRVRYQILRTQLLTYLAEFVSLLASITDTSISGLYM